MLGRHNMDDEIPLTVAKSTILKETKARFDTLLKTALSQQENLEKNNKKHEASVSKSDRMKDNKSFKNRKSNKKLSSSTQMLVSEDNHSSSSELDIHDIMSEASSDLNLEKTSNLTSVSSSDELLQSPLVERSSSVVNSELPLNKESHVSKIVHNSPLRPVPLPRRRQSTREESKDTTSSRVSSADSVMTAIEAASPSKSSVDQTSLRSFNQIDNNLVDIGSEDYELKPLKGFTPSYEEIDETVFPTKHSHHHEAKTLPMEQTTIALQNAASYEEILEENHQNNIDLTRSHGTQSIQGTSSSKKNRGRKMKQRVSSKKLKTRDGDTDSSSSIQRTVKLRRTKTKEKAKSSSDSEQPGADSIYTYEKIIGVTVHRCDTLKIDSLIRHPLVRVHILDTSSGEHLKKSQVNRSVSFFQENSNIDYIQPLTTHPCNFKDPRSLTPIWEETLVFNEDIAHILQPNSAILILFEILDFVSFETAAAQYEKLGSESGWHRIAWAFLKPQGPNNILNVDKKLRLQLYKPRFEKIFKSQSACEKCEVYRWWSRGGWIQYPSSLHVTVHSLPLPASVSPALRSSFALQPEQCSMKRDIPEIDTKNLLENSIRGVASIHDSSDGVRWSRLPAQSCKVPNHLQLKINAGVDGSFSIRFSRQGHYLAVTAASQNMHHLLVYSIPHGSEVVRFNGHPALIYCVDWSQNDDLLLSASADCTACVWSVETQSHTPIQMLPHPSFVYCALFVPGNDLSLVTGCCDHVIRIWAKSDSASAYELQQELTGHDGYVSCLCVSPGGVLFSGDSVGQIRMWQYSENKFWNKSRIISIRELQGLVLSYLLLHPGGKRMLVVARDSVLRMVDISTGVAIQWFKGVLNHRIHCKASISPCGGFVFSPSEDCTFYVWNADTGVLIASYTSLFHTLPQISSQKTMNLKSQSSMHILCGAVDYHPFEHMAAFSVYGVNAPVIVCNYTRNSSGKNIGLQLKNQNLCEKVESDSCVNLKKDFSPKFDSMMKTRNQLESDFKEEQSAADTSQHLMQRIKDTDSEEPRREEKNHLSVIIKQLDYVLQISRSSKQRVSSTSKIQKQQEKNISPSRLKSFNSSSNCSEAGSKCISMKSSHEGRNDVLYSSHESNIAEHHEERLHSNNNSSPEAVSSLNQAPESSPVQFHYVQEKQPVLPNPRRKMSKKPDANIKKQDLADISSSDTSFMSSDNEFSVNLIKRPKSQENNFKNSQEEANMKVSSYKKATVVQVENYQSNSPLLFHKETDTPNLERSNAISS